MNYRNNNDYATLCERGTCGGTRTPNLWFWRPLLCQLSYTRKSYKPDFSAFSAIRLNLGAQYYTPASSPLSSIPRPVGRGGGGLCGPPSTPDYLVSRWSLCSRQRGQNLFSSSLPGSLRLFLELV